MEEDAAPPLPSRLPPPQRKLRVGFTESNIFHQIPEDRPLLRSASLQEDRVGGAVRRFGSSLENTWKSSLENTIKGSLQNSWSLGFLFPDEDDDAAQIAALVSDDEEEDDDDDERRRRAAEEALLDHDVERNYVNYGTWGSHHHHHDAAVAAAAAKPSLLERIGSGEIGRVTLASARSCPSELNLAGGERRKVLMHRCQTAPAMSSMNRERKSLLRRPPQFEKGSSIVAQAGVGLIIYLAFGIAIYTWKNEEFSGAETLPAVDALYFCVVTMCTIGYGDITPITPFAKLFSCLFVLVGFGFIDALVSGMVTYVLDKQEHLLLSAVEGSHYRAAKKYVLNAKHGNRMRIRMKVGLALSVPVLCIFVGTMVMMRFEKLALLDAFYCTIMSVTTVGYGDHTFRSLGGRLFAALWLLFSTLAVARCFLYLAEARVDKRHRLIAKWVLQRELTVGDLVQADLDHDGCISKSEYVVYKLKEMGIIEGRDIFDICRQFDQLDVNHAGKITLARLQEGN